MQTKIFSSDKKPNQFLIGFIIVIASSVGFFSHRTVAATGNSAANHNADSTAAFGNNSAQPSPTQELFETIKENLGNSIEGLDHNGTLNKLPSWLAKAGVKLTDPIPENVDITRGCGVAAGETCDEFITPGQTSWLDFIVAINTKNMISDQQEEEAFKDCGNKDEGKVRAALAINRQRFLTLLNGISFATQSPGSEVFAKVRETNVCMQHPYFSGKEKCSRYNMSIRLSESDCKSMQEFINAPGINPIKKNFINEFNLLNNRGISPSVKAMSISDFSSASAKLNDCDVANAQSFKKLRSMLQKNVPKYENNDLAIMANSLISNQSSSGCHLLRARWLVDRNGNRSISEDNTYIEYVNDKGDSKRMTQRQLNALLRTWNIITNTSLKDIILPKGVSK